LKLVLAAALLLSSTVFATASRADDQVAPILSASRLSVASGLNYEWRTTPLANNSEPLLGRHAEWSAGIYGAYNLTPHSSLVASTTLGLDSRQFRHSIGLRLRLWRGGAK